MNRAIRTFMLACAVSALAVSGARATPINYGDFLGAGPGQFDFLQVTEDSSTDATPLFDAPMHLVNKLVFTPLSFAASTSGGGSDQTDGQLTLNIRAAAGEFLQYIILRETGDASLLGQGTNGTSAAISAMLSVINITPGGSGPYAAIMNLSPGSPYQLPGDSFVEFQGSAVINLTGLGISEIQLTLDNELFASSETGTTSIIQKKTVSIEHSHVPEPATLAILALGGAALLRRRFGRPAL